MKQKVSIRYQPNPKNWPTMFRRGRIFNFVASPPRFLCATLHPKDVQGRSTECQPFLSRCHLRAGQEPGHASNQSMTSDQRGPLSVRAEAAQPAPLSKNQRALLASHRRSPALATQNMSLLTHIEAAIDVDRWAAAFARVVMHADVLRTHRSGDDDSHRDRGMGCRAGEHANRPVGVGI